MTKPPAPGSEPPDQGNWTIAPPVLRRRFDGAITEAHGYAAPVAGWILLREIPTPTLTLVVNLGAPLRIHPPRCPSVTIPPGGGFVAGLHDMPAATETTGAQRGVQLRLTPSGSYRLFGVPMAELANRVVALDALLGSTAGELAERFDVAVTADERSAAIEAVFGHRWRAGPAPSDVVVHAWARLRASGGLLPVAALADELGCTRQHLAARFREQIGLSPKTAARLLRFRAAVTLAERPGALDWAAIAQACSYFDQAHLGNDFRRFAGVTPGAFARHRDGAIVRESQQ